MTVVNTDTGELVSEADVRASVQRVINHAESIWDEWAWQVENQTWVLLGYESWDEMRRGEYEALTSVTAPRAERPELVSRFRGAGLTQKETAATLGVSERTVKNYDEPTYRPREPKVQNCTFGGGDVVDAELVEDEPTFVSATDALAEINATPDSAPEADATAYSAADQPEGETPAPTSVESERGPATPSDAPRPPADLDTTRPIGADETVDTTTGEIIPTTPRPTPAPKPERSGEQQNAEENSRTLASSLIFLLAFQHPTQRDTARTEWEVGRSAVAPTNRDYVTPDRMRQAAEGLSLLADEWENTYV